MIIENCVLFSVLPRRGLGAEEGYQGDQNPKNFDSGGSEPRGNVFEHFRHGRLRFRGPGEEKLLSPTKGELHLALFCFSDGFLQPVERIGRLLS